MKALILAAGFGNRLQPYTKTLPKPLFPIANRPLIDIHILRLIEAGCEQIFVNVHHLHQKIEEYIRLRNYPVPVVTRYEKPILGTGGAIKNLCNELDGAPFLVINGDIFSDIDYRKVYQFHCNHDNPATLALIDDPRFNTVSVDGQQFITSFSKQNQPEKTDPGREKTYTFTGIQVIDPLIFDYIPENAFYSSIDAYRKIIADGRRIVAMILENVKWNDVGTPEQYLETATGEMAVRNLYRMSLQKDGESIKREKLKGDGSTRTWFRFRKGINSLIAAVHGIQTGKNTEVNAFVRIGKHFSRHNIPVPEIYDYDPFAGIVILEDLGDLHLETKVQDATTDKEIRELYLPVIADVLKIGIDCTHGFDPAWTHQSPRYDRNLILEKECFYFRDIFLKKYMKMDISEVEEELEGEFYRLADLTMKNCLPGLIHRDMQSRNIMVKGGRHFFIDFQGARFGPVQYDLASLLIDPYVRLNQALLYELLDFAEKTLASKTNFDPDRFRRGFFCCALCRNLQVLGAFAYLSQTLKKTHFKAHIPAAVDRLKENLARFPENPYPVLTHLAKRLVQTIPPSS